MTATHDIARRRAARREPIFHSAVAVRHAPPAQGPDWAARLVLASAFLAGVALLSLPGARGASATFGLLPLWLAVLPAVAWLALAVARRE